MIIPIKKITVGKNYWREVDPTTVEKLRVSLLKSGLMMKLLVKPSGRGFYTLIDGRHRIEAIKLLPEEHSLRVLGADCLVQGQEEIDFVNHTLGSWSEEES